jgi:glutathione synthase/RimK-type ligase-like ATP-grasp enzyme
LGTRIPTLNANAGAGDKYEQMVRMGEAGVLVPQTYMPDDNPTQFPLLARKRHHMGGTDIRLVMQAKELPWRAASGSDFFVEYIPWETEYRVWVFRGKHLGTYEKVMGHPEMYKRLGANYKNGFVFNLVRQGDIPRAAVQSATSAIGALDLDFGAVDVLKGENGKFYTLEVNTAPGVQNGTRQVLRGLADNIAVWARDPQ